MAIKFKIKKSNVTVMETKEESFTPIKLEITDIPKQTPSIYYTLNDAKEDIKEDQILISTPKIVDGSPTSKKVFMLKNKNKIISFLKQNPDRSLFEVYHQYPFKMCYDFDHDKTETSLDFEAYTKLVTDFIGSVFNDRDLAISGNTTDKKHSLHLVSSTYTINNDGDLNHIKNIIKFCHENIKHEDGIKLLRDFDDSIYKLNGSMKMIYQSKIGQNRYQEPLNNTSSDFINTHFITSNIQKDAVSISSHTIDGLEQLKDKQKMTDQKMETYTKPNVTEVMDMLNIIDVKYLDNYGDWSKIVLSAKKENVDFVYMCYISSKSLSFDGNQYSNFDDFLERYNPHSINEKLAELWNQSNNPMTYGSIKHYAKLSNLNKYDEIVKKYKPETDIFLSVEDLSSSFLIAEKIKPLLTHIKFYGKYWYVYTNTSGLWGVLKDINYQVISVLYKQINKQIQKLTYQNENVSKELIDINLKIISKMSSCLNKIDTKSFCSQLTSHLKMILLDSEIKDKLDSNKGYLAFKNGVLNLKTLEFRNGFKETDYLTKTLKYEYNPSHNKKNEEFVLSTLKKILNNKQEHLEYYLSVLGYSLIGDPEKEKSLYYLIGNKGNNGKTLVLDVLTDIMPEYVSKIDSRLLDLKYTKKHKIISGIIGKRIIWGDEFSKSVQVDAVMLKLIADGKDLDNEVLFGTTESIKIKSKLFIVSNHTPTMDADGGVSNRYKQIEFGSHFGDYKNDDYENLRFKKDVYLADKLKERYGLDIINILCRYASMYYMEGLKPVPDEFKIATNDTLEMNNFFQNWFNDNCDVGLNFQVSKAELLDSTSLSFKELKDELKRMDYKYNRDLRGFSKYQGKFPKGGFVGFKLSVKDDFIDDDELN